MMNKTPPRLMNGAEKAELAEKNMALVWYTVRQFQSTGYDVEELYSAALLGMAKALSGFDLSRGFKFSTFAMFCMKNEILMELRRGKRRISAVYYDDLTSGKNDGLTLLEMLPSSADTEGEAISKVALQKALGLLTQREREMLVLDADGQRQADIAKDYGVSQSYVSRIVAGAKQKIRSELYHE